MRLTSKRARMQGNVGERKLGTERELHRLVIKSVANTQLAVDRYRFDLV